MDWQLHRHDGAAAQRSADELVEVYTDVYSVPPYPGDPFFSPGTYAERLHAAFEMAGFETVSAHRPDDGQIIGYVHGVTLPADKPWWLALGDARPPHLIAAADAGQVFWLRELMVRSAYGNQGLGRHLHDALLADRAERHTTLTCIPGNEPAHSAYRRWGYTTMAQIQHAPDSPVYDAMFRAER